MNIKLLISFLALISLQASAMSDMEKLVALVEKNGTSTFAHGSILSSLSSLFSHSHASAVQTQLAALASAAVAQSGAAAPASGKAAASMLNAIGSLPQLPAGNATQSSVDQVLQLAQNVETQTASNTSVKAKVLRLAIGAGITLFAAADLTVNWLYSRDNSQTSAGQKASGAVFNATTDLGILGAGAYQVALGIMNWDNQAKANDAAVATKLIQAHAAAQNNAQPTA